MFGGHWSSPCGDTKYLTYQVALQNHVIEESSNFMGWISSWYITTKFGDHRYCSSSSSSRDIMFLVYHVIKQNHLIKGSGNYKNGGPPRYVTMVLEIQSF